MGQHYKHLDESDRACIMLRLRGAQRVRLFMRLCREAGATARQMFLTA